MHSDVRDTRLLAWSGLGLAGSAIVALAGPQALGDRTVGWWYHVHVPGRGAAVVWVGMALLAIAWLGVLHGSGGRLTRGRATAIALLWAAPLALAPPLFSRDVYSYLAQGAILHLGHDPYRDAPTILPGLGHAHLLAAVSPSWRHTTAPYGPLFLRAVGLIVPVGHFDLVAGALLSRALDLIGLVLLVGGVGRIARSLRADGALSVWLAAASPLCVLALVAPGHNDLLLVGLVACGVATALSGRPLTAIALCALAATIKVPALVAAVFILVAWARSERRPAARARFVAAGVALIVGVLGAITAATGVGVSWVTASIFSAPAHAHLVLTPAVAAGHTLADILGALGDPVSVHAVEAVCQAIASALVAVAGLVLLARVQVRTLVASLAAVLIAAALGGPAAWPWYLTWGAVLLCAHPAAQRSWTLRALLVAGAFLVAPDGVVVVSPDWAPYVTGAYAVLAAVALWHRRRRVAGRRSPARAGEPRTVDEPSRPGALVGS